MPGVEGMGSIVVLCSLSACPYNIFLAGIEGTEIGRMSLLHLRTDGFPHVPIGVNLEFLSFPHQI